MKIISNLGKVLTGILLAGLLAVSIQIGTGGSFISQAKAKVPVTSVVNSAGWCPPAEDICLWIEGTPIWGQEIVVTGPGPKKPL